MVDFYQSGDVVGVAAEINQEAADTAQRVKRGR
jgi:hypothetical protein